VKQGASVAKTRINEAENDADNAAERMADLNEGEGGELFRAIEEARSTQGAEVILTRTMPADKAGFCDKIPVAEFDLLMLKNKYGPGTYRVRFNGPTGFLPGGSTIKIAATPEKPTAPAGDFQSFLELQARRDSERSNKLWELAIISVPALIAGFFQRPQGNDVAALVTALKPSPGPTLADLSTAMVNMRTLTAPEKQDSKIDEILKVFEAAQNLMGDKEGSQSSGGSSWVDVIRDLIKVAPDAIKPMLEARMQAMQQQMQPGKVMQVTPAVAAPKPIGTNAATVPTMNTSANSSVDGATSPGANMREIWEPLAKQHLAKVLDWAQKDRNPEIYSEIFIDDLPDLSGYFSVDEVIGHLKNPIWYEKVCELEPRLKAHPDYCKEFHAAVVAIVEQLRAEALEDQPKKEEKTGPAIEAPTE
jgi:hypothetical protein